MNLRQQKKDLEKQLGDTERESLIIESELLREQTEKVTSLEQIIEEEKSKHFDDVQERDAQIRRLEVELEHCEHNLNEAVVRLEQVQHELDVETRMKAYLLQWKAAKMRLISQLQSKVAKD